VRETLLNSKLNVLFEACLMGIFDWLFGLPKRKHKRKEGRHEWIIVNKAKIWTGTYLSDSGDTDYTLSFKIKSGKIKKSLLKKFDNPDYRNFQFWRLKPVSNEATIVLKKSKGEGTGLYFVKLRSRGKFRMLIQDKNGWVKVVN
jgi:hypothetical protein